MFLSLLEDTHYKDSKIGYNSFTIINSGRVFLLSIQELEEAFESNDKTLTTLQDRIENLNNRMIEALYTKREGSKDGIHHLANHHRTCLP